jgi:tetratricopeptide (TPR) repeat protein
MRTTPTTSSRSAALLCLPLLAALPACSLGAGGITPVRTHFNIGVHHATAGRTDAAIHEYRLALRENPTDHRARFNLALALETKAEQSPDPERTNLANEAVTEYNAILTQHPDHLRASINLAAAEHQQGKITEAHARLERTIAAHPRAAAPRRALGALLLLEGDLPQSQSHLRAALDLDPADPATAAILADNLLQQSKPLEAHALLTTSLVSNPADLGLLLALARLDTNLNNLPSAESSLRRLLHIDPDHHAAHLALSAVLERAGDTEGATLHLWRARDTDPSEIPSINYPSRLRNLYDQLLANHPDEPSPAHALPTHLR